MHRKNFFQSVPDFKATLYLEGKLTNYGSLAFSYLHKGPFYLLIPSGHMLRTFIYSRRFLSLSSQLPFPFPSPPLSLSLYFCDFGVVVKLGVSFIFSLFKIIFFPFFGFPRSLFYGSLMSPIFSCEKWYWRVSSVWRNSNLFQNISGNKNLQLVPFVLIRKRDNWFPWIMVEMWPSSIFPSHNNGCCCCCCCRHQLIMTSTFLLLLSLWWQFKAYVAFT